MEEENVSKPRITAPLRVHFGFKPKGKGEPSIMDEVISKICRKNVPSKSPTNLKQHLQTNHPQQYGKLFLGVLSFIALIH